ncbi:hypothetical protein RQP46_010696 [Phenoliferia psychrophenolica]
MASKSPVVLATAAAKSLARTLSTSAATSASAPAAALSKAARFTLEPAGAKFPHGFLATGLHCGVKKDPLKLDLGVIISDRPCSAAAMFTKNAFQAAPVTVSKQVLAAGNGTARGIVVNSGCANAVTGAGGLADAQAMSDKLDSFLAASSSSSATGTLVMSTGVIGQRLPIDKILAGVTASTATLGSTYSAWSDAAKAFMTTDTFPKLRTRAFELAGQEVRMVGIDKGAGMIHPNMGPPGPLHATLLGMIATDASVSPKALQDALTYAVERSFNSISVDGDMSTNDTIVVLANGASGSKLVGTIDETPEDYVRFRDELTDFAAELAQLIVRDGEGATKFVKISVNGAPTYAGAHKIASTISTSSLVKTALHGEDANWGRILCAVGYAQPGDFAVDPTLVSVSFIPSDGSAPLRLLVKGEPEQVDEARAKEILEQEDLEIQVELGMGEESATYWTCDLSHEYIAINAAVIQNVVNNLDSDVGRIERPALTPFYSSVGPERHTDGAYRMRGIFDRDVPLFTLGILQLYAALSSLSLSVFATAIDAVADPIANGVLALCHRKARNVDLHTWPSGGSKFGTVGDVVYSFSMGAVSIILVAFAIQQLIAGDPGKEELHIPALAIVGISFVTKLFIRNDLVINGFGLFTSAAGVKIVWFLDPMGALLISVGLIIVWGMTVYDMFGCLAGRAAPPEFQKLVIYKAMTFADDILSNYYVELDVVMDRETPLWQAHDTSQALQDKLEELPLVDRCHVHVDFETTHKPEHRKQQ